MLIRVAALSLVLVAVAWFLVDLRQAQAVASVQPASGAVHSAKDTDEPSSLSSTDGAMEFKARWQAEVERHVLHSMGEEQKPLQEPARLSLEVVDRVSQAHVDEVYLARADMAWAGSMEWPRVEDCLWKPEDLGSSPVSVARASFGPGLWVGGSGYSWVHVSLAREPSEIRVELDRAAHLELVAERSMKLPGASLRVESVDGQVPALQVPLEKAKDPGARERFRFEGITPGAYRVSVQPSMGVGEGWYEREVYVSAGETKVLDLSEALADGEAGQSRVTVRLHLPFPKELLTVLLNQSPMAMLRPQGAEAIRNGARSAYQLHSTSSAQADTALSTLEHRVSLPAGRYEMSLHPFGPLGSFAVASQPYCDFDFELPPLAECLLSVADSDGRQLRIERAHVARVSGDEVRRGHAWQDDDGTWRLITVPGTVRVNYTVQGSPSVSESFELNEGPNELRLTMPTLYSRTVGLAEDAHPSSLPYDAWAGLRLVDGAGTDIPFTLRIRGGDGMRAHQVEVTTQRSGAFTAELPLGESSPEEARARLRSLPVSFTDGASATSLILRPN